MAHIQPIHNQFGYEESTRAPLEKVSSSRATSDVKLTRAIEDMLRQGITERDIPVSRSMVAIEVRRHTDFPYDMQVFDQEHADARTHQRKKRRFAVGRAAARAALERIGLDSVSSIGRGVRGEPLWPQGICGSITHCCSLSIVVAARCDGPVAVGIDLENVTRLHELSIVDLICSAGESDWVSAGDQRTRLVMMFSAKEALYKGLYPFLKRYIDFQDVELSWSDPHKCFECRFLKQPTLGLYFTEPFKVYCRRSGQFVVSLMMCDLASIINRTQQQNFAS